MAAALAGETELSAVPGDDVWTQEELEAVTALIQKDVEGIRKAEFSHSVPVKIIDKAGFVKFAIKSMEESTKVKERKKSKRVLSAMTPLRHTCSFRVVISACAWTVPRL